MGIFQSWSYYGLVSQTLYLLGFFHVSAQKIESPGGFASDLVNVGSPCSHLGMHSYEYCKVFISSMQQ